MIQALIPMAKQVHNGSCGNGYCRGGSVYDSDTDSDGPAGDVELKTDPMVDEFPGEVTDYDKQSEENLSTGDEFKKMIIVSCLTLIDSDIDEDARIQFEI